MNRTVLIAGVLLVIPLLIFLALGFRSDPNRIESPLIGQPAPRFALADLDGKVVSLADLAGRPVVINFWATWCQPCVVEHPTLLAGARRYADRVAFLGVVYQDRPDLIRRFVAERGAWGPSLIDNDSEVAIAYGVYGAPETFILDANGVIVDKAAGLISGRWLVGTLDSLLATPAS
jgi:cytochrome c biogenesis protein CcmG/thiol:disulfide interchange protein DsbE